jgi:signal transduction histidine kinase
VEAAVLEERVRERTLELKLENEELRESVLALQEDQGRLVVQTMGLFERVVAGITHGINTPLGILISNLDIASRSLMKVQNEVETLTGHSSKLSVLMEPALSLVDVNREACNRIGQLVSTLKCFVHLDEASVKETEINESLKSTLTLIQHEFDDRISVKEEFANLPLIRCYPDRLNMVFMNLLLNSCQAIQGKGEIRIETRLQGDYVEVIITDTGNEIQEEVAENVSVPASGTSLNLSILTQIIKSQSGRLEFRNESGQGRKFTILLPVQGPTSV